MESALAYLNYDLVLKLSINGSVLEPSVVLEIFPVFQQNPDFCAAFLFHKAAQNISI